MTAAGLWILLMGVAAALSVFDQVEGSGGFLLAVMYGGLASFAAIYLAGRQP